jgi:DNA-binding NarL/FixJ family response regulator
MRETIHRPSRSPWNEDLHDERFNQNSKQVTRVVFVEPHTLIREAVERILARIPQIQVCASRPHISAELEFQKGDVLLLGSSLAIYECLEYVKTMRELCSSLGIVTIQQRLAPETAFPLIKQGVQGLLGEEASVLDLAQAITAASMGQTFLDQRARTLINDFVSHVPLHFTAREMQVLPLLCSGLSNFCIAQRLALKEKTIEKHLTHIYQKLQSRSRTEAILRIQTLPSNQLSFLRPYCRTS